MPAEENVTEKQSQKLALASSTKRQFAWLCKTSAPRGAVGWKPRKRYRTSAAKWVYTLDNQIRVSTDYAGLSFFHLKWAV